MLPFFEEQIQNCKTFSIIGMKILLHNIQIIHHIYILLAGQQIFSVQFYLMFKILLLLGKWIFFNIKFIVFYFKGDLKNILNQKNIITERQIRDVHYWLLKVAITGRSANNKIRFIEQMYYIRNNNRLHSQEI